VQLAFSVLAATSTEFALQERSLPFHTPQRTTEVAQGMLTRFPVGQYPHLAELTAEHVLQPGYDYGNEFAFWLELILEGLERAGSSAAGA
jgi:hypothetical protein